LGPRLGVAECACNIYEGKIHIERLLAEAGIISDALKHVPIVVRKTLGDLIHDRKTACPLRRFGGQEHPGVPRPTLQAAADCPGDVDHRGVRDGFGGEGRASLLRDARQDGLEGCLSAWPIGRVVEKSRIPTALLGLQSSRGRDFDCISGSTCPEVDIRPPYRK